MKAHIIVDSSKVIGRKSPYFFGSFIEHVHQCVYPGIFDPKSVFADENGFRKDVIEEIRTLAPGTIRWPGGNFSSWYHWKQGIGSKEKRKTMISYADDIIREESHLFGTDEYVKFCNQVGTTPYITVNAGDGTPREAAEWVEYCNYSGNTYYADLRRKNGNNQPFGVKYWEIGNEIYGDWQVGTKDAVEYSKALIEFSKAMKRIDPSIKVVAVGMGKHDPDWDRIVLDTAWDYIDGISVHIYIGRHEYFDSFGQIFTIADHLRKMEDDIIRIAEQKKSKKNIFLALSEWGIWYKKGHKDNLDEVYNLKDGLVFAGVMNLLLKFCRTLQFTHQSMLVNCLGLIRTKPDRIVRQTIYYPFSLFANHTGDTVLAPQVWSEGFSCKDYRYFPWPTFDVGKDNFQLDESKVPQIHNIPYLDVSATLNSKTDELCLIVVNRHPEKAINTTIEFRGYECENNIYVMVVNGDDVYATNDFGKENVKMEKFEEKIEPKSIKFSFQPHSITALKIKTRKAE
ncbi:MAG: hypothetical protein NC913_07115 [Candidatus Omnitrophica bacterium]|nr:hypothetical protein [Candidatus Omnitrophota bacterium]